MSSNNSIPCLLSQRRPARCAARGSTNDVPGRASVTRNPCVVQAASRGTTIAVSDAGGLAGLQCATLFQEAASARNQDRAQPVRGHYSGLSCQRAIHSDTDRRARTPSTFASICKGCSRKPRSGRCRGLSGCFRTSSRLRRCTRKEPFSHASYPPGSPVRGPGCGGIIRAVGVDDHRPAGAGHDRTCSRSHEVRPAPDVHKHCIRPGPAAPCKHLRDRASIRRDTGGETMSVYSRPCLAPSTGASASFLSPMPCAAPRETMTHDDIYLNRFGEQVETVTTASLKTGPAVHGRARRHDRPAGPARANPSPQRDWRR